MYYIGLLLLFLIIVPYLVFYKKEKNNIEEMESIQPVDDGRLRDIAMHLPSQIGYLNNERRFSYRFEIDGIIHKIMSFYSSFDARYEDYIEHSKELLNNRLPVQNSIQKLKDIRMNQYYLQDSANYNKNSLETAVSFFLPLCGYRVDKNRIISFITSYQFSKTMKYNEIFSFINITKIKLMEKLSQICGDIEDNVAEYKSVYAFITKLEKAPQDLPAYENEIRKIVDRKPYSYLVKLNIALLQHGVSVGGYYRAYAEQLKSKGIHIENITLQFQKIMSEKSAVCGNIINSLRSIDDIDMTDFIKSVSYTENILLKDPVGIFRMMTEDTKKDYRRKIQNIARKIGRSEFDVAAMSLKLARESDNHIGAYLYRNRKLSELYQKFKYRHRKKPASGLLFYTAVLAATFLLGGLFAWFLVQAGKGGASAAVLPIVTLPLFYKAAYWAAGRLADKLLCDNKVPMLEMDDIPESAKTIAIIPVLAISKEQMKNVIKTLELIMLTNSYRVLNYALVVDYKASSQQQDEKDIELRRFILDELQALNGRYGIRFHYFSRSKVYNPRTGLHEAWERKRGAIIEFNKLLLEGRSNSFDVDRLDPSIAGTKYVVTFDEDARITHGEILKMVGAMHHPLNKPLIDGGRLTAGYTILQPRVRVKLADANISSFTRAFSGSHGYDHYSNANGGLSTKLFGKGMFFGKGIYSPQEFNQLLSSVFPDNRILSHDMIEGEIAGCGFINATIYEGFPAAIEEYFQRFDRWLRGDFQLLPWLFSKTRDKDRTRIPNPLSCSAKAGIVNNMIQYLAAPGAFAGILLSMFMGSLLQYAAFILAPIVVWMLLNNLAALARFRRFRKSSMLEADRALLTLALLPLRAWITIRGIVLVACRLATNSPKLMQWNTAASYSRNGKAQHFFKMMWPSYLVLIAALASAFVWPTQAIYAISTGLLFLMLVLTAYIENKPDAKEDRKPTDDQREFLAWLLGKTYKYFEDFCDGTTGLICDNYQEKHKVGAARRTSPTNIGFSLLSHCVALAHKLITEDVFCQRVNKTIDTLCLLEKWHGNLFNWYVTTDGSLLQPRYVSTVDSGNLKICLIYLYEFISRLPEGYREVLARVKALIEDMDLTKLYNFGKKQFHIGYNLDTDSFSDSHYDLYMSESRLTSITEIARGNIPVAGWDSLSRNDNCIKNRNIIMSWGGSTFEYLMPSLFLPVFEHSFEDQAIDNYLGLQLEYCNKLKVPMGISESAYNDEDLDKNYQYRSFGIPGAGYRRDIETDVVCAPYAAVLGLAHMPDEIINALYQYMAIGASGSYGMYEAVDFTKSRLDTGESHQVIQNYMAHHQGMIIAAIHNFLNDNEIKKTITNIPWMQTIETLLQEQKVDGCRNKISIINLNIPPEAEPEEMGSIATYRNLEPKTHFPTGWLSNGSYHTAVSINGSGYSRLNEHMLNRGSNEVLDGGTGIHAFLYDDGRICSFSGNIGQKAPKESFRINIGSIVFDKRYDDLHLKTNIYVCSGENVEIRKYTIRNLTNAPKRVGMKLYSEIAMSLPEAYRSHRVYQNLFMESSTEAGIINFSRRKRYKEEIVPYMVWRFIGLEENESIVLSNDREQALGRYNSLKTANFHLRMIDWSRNAIDHCALVQTEIVLEPCGERVLYLLQMAEFDQTKCVSIASKYNNTAIIEYAISQVAPAQRARYRFHLVEGRHLRLINKLLPALLYRDLYTKGCYENLLENKLSSRCLWRLGISGNKPIILASIYSESTMTRLEHLFKITSLLAKSGIDFDFVVINHLQDNYENRVRDGIYRLRNLYSNCGNLRIIGIDMLSSEELVLLRSLSIADFNVNMPLIVQYDYSIRQSQEPRLQWADTSIDDTYLEYFNGYGGFDENTDNYVINIVNGAATPMPWSNILTNGEMGAILTEKGISYLWYKNSREMPLTKWHNDPVRDECPISIKLYKGGAFVYEFGASSKNANWQVVHARGYSTYGMTVGNLKLLTTVLVDIKSDRLIINMDIQNLDNAAADLTLEFSGEFVMGGTNGRYVIAGSEGNSLFVKNDVDINMSGQKLYICSSVPKKVATSEEPALGGHAAGSCSFAVKSGLRQDCSIVFSMNKCRESLDFSETLAQVKEYWDKRRGVVKIDTPDKSLNILFNSWLQYQTIASRIMGRCGYYQSGGAFGFRDQLQDAFSLLWASPMVMRNMLVEFAGHQFLSGDVQHWWHNPFKGVRTRIKDDMLFLVYGVCEYIDITQDYSVLEEHAEYLKDAEIPPGEDDWYGMPEKSGISEPLLQHCLKAIDRVCVYGRYGLPLIEGGDWNDGLNKVGNKGLGESVWLGFFLYYLMNRFNGILLERNEHNEAEMMLDRINYLRSRLHDAAWDGKWYKRAFMDDGTPLGSEKSLECKIDCLSQSWAVISGVADSIKGNMALDSVLSELYDKQHDILKLMKPPFDAWRIEPGYIKGYIPGVRENGAQYTHAALWMVWALALAGRGNDACRLMHDLVPINHSMSKTFAEKYKTEPYVVAADIYSAPGQEGRGGWTWYTGSAAWMYKIILENILGLEKKGERLSVNPCISAEWKKFEVQYKHINTYYDIVVKNPEGRQSGVKSLVIDGKECSDGWVELVNDAKEHKIYVIM